MLICSHDAAHCLSQSSCYVESKFQMKWIYFDNILHVFVLNTMTLCDDESLLFKRLSFECCGGDDDEWWKRLEEWMELSLGCGIGRGSSFVEFASKLFCCGWCCCCSCCWKLDDESDDDSDFSAAQHDRHWIHQARSWNRTETHWHHSVDKSMLMSACNIEFVLIVRSIVGGFRSEGTLLENDMGGCYAEAVGVDVSWGSSHHECWNFSYRHKQQQNHSESPHLPDSIRFVRRRLQQVSCQTTWRRILAKGQFSFLLL